MAAPDPERLAVFRSFLAANACLDRELTVALDTERDLPLPWFEAMNALQEAGGRLRVMELSERALVSPSSLSRQLSRMEEEGLVRRERGVGEDQRAVLVVLTREGRESWRRSNSTYLRVVKRLFISQLTDTDVVSMQRVLAKVREAGTPHA